jgi:phosphoserine phosphatase
MKKGIKPWYRPFFIDRFVRIIYAVLHKLFKKDFKLELTKRYFKGLKKEKLKKLNEDYLKRYINKLRRPVFTKLLEEKEKSDVLLLSASINPPIDGLKEKYQLSGFSSLLEEKNGVYTGRTTLALRGAKEQIFEKQLFDLAPYEEIEFYTDNRDDIGLMEYLQSKGKKLKIYIIPYHNRNYRTTYFTSHPINYEFMD